MELSIALNRYDRHAPFFNNTVMPPEGVTLKPLEVGESLPFRDGADRHDRILHDLEFDIGEMGLSGFVMAVERNPDIPLVGIPVFPRRFFSFGQIYVNPDSGIEKPDDLHGKRIGVHAFQTTLSVLAKGDLKLDYGFRWQECDWVCMRDEPVPVEFGDDVSITRMPEGKDMGEMLLAGEVDALMSPQPRPSMLAQPDRYRRLFPDVAAEDTRYYKKYGYYPIMHLMVMRRSLADDNPGLAKGLITMFDQAYDLALSYYNDSNYSLLVWGRSALENQFSALGDNPWTSGFAANKKYLQQFIDFSHDQRLIDAPYPAENLFHDSVRDT